MVDKAGRKKKTAIKVFQNKEDPGPGARNDHLALAVLTEVLANSVDLLHSVRFDMARLRDHTFECLEAG